MHKKLCYFLLSLCVCFLYFLSGTVHAVDVDAAGKKVTASIDTGNDAFAPYQAIIDKLNEEYGFSMSIAYEEIEKGRCRSPLTIGLEDYERSLRQSIEESIRFNAETKEKLSQFGDIKWEKGELTECSITLPPSGSYFDSVLDPSVIIDSTSFSSAAGSQVAGTKSADTVTSIQARKDPSGNYAFVMQSDMTISPTWRYYGTPSFSYFQIANVTNNSYYIPQSVSYSKTDSLRTCAVTYTCTHYDGSGVILEVNVPVCRDYNATSDCITNWPNYSIPHTITNKSYNKIDYCTNQINCAGYAWGYNDFVDRIKLVISFYELNSCSNISELLTLVKNKSNAFMSAHGINATEIANYNSTIDPSSQYRIVLRVGYIDSNNNGQIDLGLNPWNDVFDYHWWMQLGDGSWADKRGYLPSRIVPNTNNDFNPINTPWTMWDYGELVQNNFYYSSPVYYKVSG